MKPQPGYTLVGRELAAMHQPWNRERPEQWGESMCSICGDAMLVLYENFHPADGSPGVWTGVCSFTCDRRLHAAYYALFRR